MFKLTIKNILTPLLLGITATLSSTLAANARPVVIQRTTVYPIQQPTVIYTNPVYAPATGHHPLSRSRRKSTIHFPSPQIIVPGHQQVVYPHVIVNPTVVYPQVYRHHQNQGSYIYLGSDGVQIRLGR